uniref:G-protein coupled receptors family 1 profile domain-containing protein n=1 Tax=Chelydra serpentina TaxID=8475 RepID=A0A8C3SDZ9_CHESE
EHPLLFFGGTYEGQDMSNQITVTEFLLLGFSDIQELQILPSVVFLVIYVAALVGNLVIITVIIFDLDPALYSPMYFFLRNLSCLEICFTSVIVPKLLVNILSANQTISFHGCVLQMYFSFFFGSTECFLLATMAYDLVMNRRVCIQLAVTSWVSGIPVGIVQTTWLFSFPFCGPTEINHFFCDSPPVLKLVCGDTYLFEMYAVTGTIVIVLFPFILILISYIRIISTILRIPSTEGRLKTFSTCSSHLLVVTLFYCTAGLTYFRPKASYSPDTKKLLSLSYTVFTPMLNPIIYSLRNKEVNGALRRMLGWQIYSRQL